jgi:hypothetical protein
VGELPLAPASQHAVLGAAARVNAHPAPGPRKHLQRGLAWAVSQQSRTMRRRPPRSPATEALSRSNTLLQPADDEGQVSRTAVGPEACDRFPSRRPAIDCCCPLPSIWCAQTQLITISMPSLRIPVPKASLALPVSRNIATEPCSLALRARSTARPLTIDQGTRVI